MVMFADVKTPSSRRTLAIPTFLSDMLAEHVASSGRRAESDLLFTAPEGGPLRRSTFRNRVWEPAVFRAGLRGVTFHALRHSAVGLMIEVGAHIEAIKQRLGHASIRTTSDVYGSLLPAVDEAVTSRLDGLFSNARGLGAAREDSDSEAG